MEIRKATQADCRAIAELALMAGEGIPAFFWEASRRPGQDILDVGAENAGCTLLSIEVFRQNSGAVRLYQRLGYVVTETRPVIPHPCHPYTGELVLLTKLVGATPAHY